ncbi:MAG TPA: 23S rRNA (guanosine(2251)-2'-O)-methyltransferase RlmB [Saprospiraceae bacterium]|nr:23S rRNA (guanosine(2251)-2'-O)-methyltransferase RlmB [Saprospiraceae bacterium]
MENKQIVYGRKPVLELLKAGSQIEKIFIQQGLHGPFEVELRNLMKGKDIPLSVIPIGKLDKISRGNHQGIIAYTSLVDYVDFESLVALSFESSGAPLFLFLEGITDVRNFGAILRTAEVLGVDAIFSPSKNTALVNEDMIKTSAGALFNIPMARVKSMDRALQYLRDCGVFVAVSHLGAEKRITELDFTVPVCVVIGSEETGVSEHTTKLADSLFLIPQQGQIDSLNVAVSAGVILYEIQRQRGFQKF